MTDKIEALREKLATFVERFGIEHEQMKWERETLEDGLEMVVHRGDTIFFGDPNHQDPSDKEPFDLIVALANATPDLLTLLDRLRSSNEAMRKALEDLCGVMNNCSVTSGICGCGESMDNHSEWSGHSPTDYGSYAAEQAYQSARAALSSLQEEEAQ